MACRRPRDGQLVRLPGRMRRGIAAALLIPAILMTLVGCSGQSAAPGGRSTPSPPKPGYFGTEPSHALCLPRSDAYCASAVVLNSWEPRPDHEQANHNIPSPPHNWSIEDYWTLWRDKRDQVTGNFAGTTTEIIQRAACKWGIDEDTIRAAAVKGSYWHMGTEGDQRGPPGEASYGLLQIKNPRTRTVRAPSFMAAIRIRWNRPP
jgi:hypothetical protein